jgi:hypothetical protein
MRVYASQKTFMCAMRAWFEIAPVDEADNDVERQQIFCRHRLQDSLRRADVVLSRKDTFLTSP